MSQGLVPTVQFEREHTFRSLRQFPQLRVSAKEMESMRLAHRKQKFMARQPLLTSTHRLEQLSKSSLDEVSSFMDDYRKILLGNRRAGSFSSSASLALGSQESGQSEGFGDSLVQLTALQRADAQLTRVSISFDAQSYNSHLAGFQGSRLSKAEFETLLRRCLNVVLSAGELEALFRRMDADQSALVDGVEFIRYFFALGNRAREKMQAESREIRHKKRQAQEDRRLLAMRKAADWEAAQIAQYKERDLPRALDKLRSL
ncbi:hypothetical protein EON64_16260, partial [archaeon]